MTFLPIFCLSKKVISFHSFVHALAAFSNLKSRDRTFGLRFNGTLFRVFSMPETGIEPVREKSRQDFKSHTSVNSATLTVANGKKSGSCHFVKSTGVWLQSEEFQPKIPLRCILTTVLRYNMVSITLE